VDVFLIFVILATVGSIIGYSTKWTSAWLMFNPPKYVGVAPFGWQGVVQRRSPKFAVGVAEMLEGIAPVEEVTDRIQSDEFASVMIESLGPLIEELTPNMINVLQDGLWDSAAPEARTMLHTILMQEARGALVEIIDSAKPLLSDAVDLKPMVVDMLSGENAERLARLVKTIAAHELRTVIRYGAVVGFFVGLAEAGIYLTFGRWWLLPAVGAIDGLVNNWMGIQMIFRPLQPRKYLGLFRYQGLFPARQAEIAHDYGQMIANEVLTPRLLVEDLSRSDSANELLVIVRDVLDRRLANQLLAFGPMLGVEPTEEMRIRAVDVAMKSLGADGNQLLPALGDFPAVEAYLNRRLAIAETIESKLAEMSKAEFETIVRGIFEEDEKTLIGVGGVLGVAIGSLQAAIVLGLGLH
jgi:uncharacterized membrane protein YheB (UPF0754 family)